MLYCAASEANAAGASVSSIAAASMHDSNFLQIFILKAHSHLIALNLASAGRVGKTSVYECNSIMHADKPHRALNLCDVMRFIGNGIGDCIRLPGIKCVLVYIARVEAAPID